MITSHSPINEPNFLTFLLLLPNVQGVQNGKRDRGQIRKAVVIYLDGYLSSCTFISIIKMKVQQHSGPRLRDILNLLSVYIVLHFSSSKSYHVQHKLDTNYF